jgi:hypothetical protein
LVGAGDVSGLAIAAPMPMPPAMSTAALAAMIPTVIFFTSRIVRPGQGRLKTLWRGGMPVIEGQLTDFRAFDIADLVPQFLIIAENPAAYVVGGTAALMVTQPIDVVLDENTKFSQAVAGSDQTVPPTRYTFLVKWLDTQGVTARQDAFEHVWVPSSGAWTLEDLLSGQGIQSTQVFWQATPPDPWPSGAIWVVTADYAPYVAGDVLQK